MTRPTDRNRLNSAASPYLQQHADNPVHWQPWDETALEAALETDRPIFLSIGYSSCHWCHVMAEESFEDPAIATRLNEAFVPIKVDREERPDIDSIYMRVCQQVTRGGCGWPLSVWLTPEGLPFYIGTYFPPTQSHGRPAFGTILDRIAESWASDRSTLEERGESWLSAAKATSSTQGAPKSADETDTLETAEDRLLRMADRVHGGFGDGQKFPHTDRLLLLVHLARRTRNDAAEPVLTEALSAMISGGLRDQLGEGFHRYCVDRTWTVPHFEKMLYDNAEIPRALLHGFSLTGTESYAAVARQTFDFVERQLTHPSGGFFSTLDARSQPIDGTAQDQTAVEGAYYTWTPDSVRSAMATEQDEADQFEPAWLTLLFRERFGVTESGNFEGKTVLTQSRSIEDLAAEFDRSREDIERGLDEAVKRARTARSERPRPPRDEKILADWNGLMIGTLATGSIVLQEPEYAEMADRALDFVRDKHWNGTTLAHRFKDGDRLAVDYLSDYAYLARGALRLHGATGDLDSLSFALDLTRAMQARFWDADQETLYYTASGTDGLPMRPTEVQEGSTPSSTGVAVEVFAAMDHFDPTAGFGDVAGRLLQSHRSQIESAPERDPTLTLASQIVDDGHLEITIAADSVPTDWQAVLGDTWRSGMLVTRRPPDEGALSTWVDELDLDSVPAIWDGRNARGKPTAFVCRRACSPPITSTEDLEEWIGEFAIGNDR